MKPHNTNESPSSDHSPGHSQVPFPFPFALNGWNLVHFFFAIFPLWMFGYYVWHGEMVHYTFFEPAIDKYDRWLKIATNGWYWYVALYLNTVACMVYQKTWAKHTEAHFIALFLSVFPLIAGFLIALSDLYFRFYDGPYIISTRTFSDDQALRCNVQTFVAGWLISFHVLAAHLAYYNICSWIEAWDTMRPRVVSFCKKAIWAPAAAVTSVIIVVVAHGAFTLLSEIYASCQEYFYHTSPYYGAARAYAYGPLHVLQEWFAVTLVPYAFLGLFVTLAVLMSRQRDFLDRTEAYILSLATCALPLAFCLAVVMLNFLYVCVKAQIDPAFSITYPGIVDSFDFAYLGFYLSFILVCLQVCYYLCGFPFVLFAGKRYTSRIGSLTI